MQVRWDLFLTRELLGLAVVFLAYSKLMNCENQKKMTLNCMLRWNAEDISDSTHKEIQNIIDYFYDEADRLDRKYFRMGLYYDDFKDQRNEAEEVYNALMNSRRQCV